MMERIVRYNSVPPEEVAQGVFQPYPKLVRFQRTNHGWTDGIYDDSLPISRRERVAGAIPAGFRIWNFDIISDFAPIPEVMRGVQYVPIRQIHAGCRMTIGRNRDDIRISDFLRVGRFPVVSGKRLVLIFTPLEPGRIPEFNTFFGGRAEKYRQTPDVDTLEMLYV